MSRNSTHPTVAYSYIRFSSREQRKGDSLRRQTEMAEAFCARRGWTLSGATYRDLGVSAWRGKNALVGNLGEFLHAIKNGSVLPGQALIVESLDRISRQGIDEGYDLIKRILKAGITLVTLSPEREFDESATKSLSKGALEIQLILERAAEESERKSNRLSEVWKEKKRKARDEGKTATKLLPAWVEDKNGWRVLIPERAAIIRRIFILASTGYGNKAIARQLNAEKVPSFGRSGAWTQPYITQILKDRRAIGEYQPRFTDDKPDGKPIVDYFPAAVTMDEWLMAQGAKSGRKVTYKAGNPVDVQAVLNLHAKGERMNEIERRLGIPRTRIYRILARQGKHKIKPVGERKGHPFAGLLINARDGRPYYPLTRVNKGENYKVLIASSAYEGRNSHAHGFPYEIFEQALLSALKEINPREILAVCLGGREEIGKIEAEMAGVEAELDAASAFMSKNGFSETIGKRISDLEKYKRSLIRRREEAEIRAANLPEQAWRETKTLLETLDKAPDKAEAKVRLRSALRRIVKEIRLIVAAPRGKDRICEVQIFFQGEDTQTAYRNVTIFYRGGTGNQCGKKPATWSHLTHSQPKGSRPGLPPSSPNPEDWPDNTAISLGDPYIALDLRDPAQAKEVVETLENYPSELFDLFLAGLKGKAYEKRVREMIREHGRKE